MIWRTLATERYEHGKRDPITSAAGRLEGRAPSRPFSVGGPDGAWPSE